MYTYTYLNIVPFCLSVPLSKEKLCVHKAQSENGLKIEARHCC